MTASYERITGVLAASGSKSKDVKQDRSMWQCPAHPDNNPSLEVKHKTDKTILCCYAGCQTDDVVAALGLEWADTFDVPLEGGKAAHDLRGQLVRSYLYTTINGDPWFWVDRYFPKTFRQRMPGVEPVRDLSDKREAYRLGLDTNLPPIIYLADRVWRAVQHDGVREVWWLDGEKDAERAWKDGVVATCAPGFRKWDERYAQSLRSVGVERVVMVVDQDKDRKDGTLGAGQQAATIARQGFRAAGIRVKTVGPAVGKDYSDHRDAGLGLDAFVPDSNLAVRPKGMAASDLVGKTFEPVQWAIHGLLTAGVAVMAGAPKIGKSWIALDVGCAVACGGKALGYLQTTQGDVLYLAREDSYRRLQSRLALVMGGDLSAVPAALEVVPQEVDWPSGEEGIGHLTEWAEQVRSPRLVILDTLAKVEPDMGEDSMRRRGAYAGEYAMMARYKRWADTFNCAVLMVHHDNKAGAREKQGMANDPFTKVSGTRGITGAADTLWFLESVHGTHEGQLHVTGRDVAEQSLDMHKVGALWTATSVVDLGW